MVSNWGFTVSLFKSKEMKIGNEPSFVNYVPVCGGGISLCGYSTITSDR